MSARKIRLGQHDHVPHDNCGRVALIVHALLDTVVWRGQRTYIMLVLRYWRGQKTGLQRSECQAKKEGWRWNQEVVEMYEYCKNTVKC